VPTILRIDSLRVTIYPNDHPPPHVHVIGAKGEAVFLLNCPGGRPNCAKTMGSTDPKYAGWQPICRLILPPFALDGGQSVEISDAAIQQAEQRMGDRMKSTPRAIAARYDRRVSRIMSA
jgi:Domain of unknown function (DUF4160)